MLNQTPIMENTIDNTWTKQLNSPRICHYVYQLLSALFVESGEFPPHLSDFKRQLETINVAFNHLDLNESYKSEILSTALHHAHNALLPDSAFEWISKREVHLYLFCFYYLQKKYQLPVKIRTSYSDYLSDIVGFFDATEEGVEHQINLMDDLKLQWSQCFNNGVDFDWLDIHHAEQVEWAWQYDAMKHLIDPCLPIINNKDKYWAIRLSIDFWPVPAPEKRLLLKKMKEACYKYLKRAASAERKQFNFIMDKTMSDKLDALKARKGLSRNKLVEEMINAEYLKLITN